MDKIRFLLDSPGGTSPSFLIAQKSTSAIPLMAVPNGLDGAGPSSPLPPPLSVEYLERYLVVLKRFSYLLDVAESSECGLDAFLAVAEYRYTLYLDLLGLQSFDEAVIIPPWDVAIIWQTHLRCPYEYLADVVYRPAYSQISKKTLDFCTEGLAHLVEQDVWSDSLSQSIWEDVYPEIEYQLWPSLPSRSLPSPQLTLHHISIPCPNDECGVPVHLLPHQLIGFRTITQSVHCETCKISFKKSDVFFGNMRRDWRKVQTQSNQNAMIAIKGAVLNGKGQPNFREALGGWMRNWAMQCLQDSTSERRTVSSMESAVERLKHHWGPYELEILSALQKTIPYAYKSHIWPNLSIHLAGALLKYQRFVDREIVNAEWTTKRGSLSVALQRYLRYMSLRGKGWEQFLYPDMRFVRDAHRILPSSYHRWCEDHVGERLVAGIDSYVDRKHQTPESQRRTTLLWRAEFDKTYGPLGSDASDDSKPPSSYSGSERLNYVDAQRACDTCPQDANDADSAFVPLSRLKALYDKPLQGSEFRLLHFKYRCAEDILHYELTQHSLDAVPDYTATSYVWGSPYLKDSGGEVDNAFDGVRVISCNNIIIAVTRNAYALLEKLSIFEPQICVWMDCLCINQEDDDEKSEQVLRMDRIYTKASRVFVWLGPNRALLDDFHWACTTLQIRYREIARSRGLPSTLKDSQFWNANGVPNAYRRFHNAVLFSAICRWFTRTWIVQEAILAQKIVVLCGSNQLPWDGICWLGRTFPTSAPLAQKSILPKGLERLDAVGRRAWQIQTHRGRLVLLSTYYRAAKTETSRLLINLLDYIETFQGTECFDHRDKVYAMLAVARSKLDAPDAVVSNIIPVDYKNLSCKDVYYQLAKAAMEHLGSLIILHYVKMVPFLDDDNDECLPSWVPDFSRTLNITLIHHRALSSDPFRIWANQAVLTQRPHVQGNKLILSGIKIGNVHYPPGDSKSMRTLPLLFWLRICASSVSRAGLSTRIEALISTAVMRNIRRNLPSLDHDVLKQSFHSFVRFRLGVGLWQCQTADNVDYVGILHEVRTTLIQFTQEVERGELPTMDMILEVQTWKATSEDQDGSDLERKSSIASLLDLEMAASMFSQRVEQLRSLFRTEGGTLAMGPLTESHNNEVWAIAGADVPFILRPVKSSDGSKTFRLIGDCYLHEYMHGEMVEDDPNITRKLEPIVLV